MGRPLSPPEASVSIHNLSSLTLSHSALQLLSKGLSFATIHNAQTDSDELKLLRDFNMYAKSLRRIYVNSQYNRTPPPVIIDNPTITSKVYRALKFLPPPSYSSPVDRYSGYSKLENYIDCTKCTIEENLTDIFCTKKETKPLQSQALTELKKRKTEIVIKPADKNLGIVLMDSIDYIKHCLQILREQSVYKRVQDYPKESIKRQVYEVLSKFHATVKSFDKRLKEYLLPTKDDCQVPQFYGIPKIHKQYKSFPPLRPIVANCNSVLTPVSKLLNHVLQPLAQVYNDHLNNSAELSLILESLQVPPEAILVSIDVESLYPSIPQQECLQIIYSEMLSHRHTVLLDPNLIVQLLHICVNSNYFRFGPVTFQQVQGTAMGAAFSPTIANIFMSTTLKKFLSSQPNKPLLIKRYIDDIFMIWMDGEVSLLNFLSNLNSFHPSLTYKFTYSTKEVPFLDLMIYKGPRLFNKKLLDTKTYQKEQNLYQYLHYSSNHPQHIFKSLITGECTRFVRTNTTIEEFHNMTKLLTTRLQLRGYPQKVVMKSIKAVSYTNRQQLISSKQRPPMRVKPAIFKCLPPPNFNRLKQIILQNFKGLLLPSPRIISLRHRTLGKELVRAKPALNETQLLTINVTFEQVHQHTSACSLPTLQPATVRISKCMGRSCATCQHFLCNKYFSSSKTNKSYPIRHSFSCCSRYVIYLITCSKCRKQYVGYTSQQLRVRINHHRSNVINKKRTYISNHFNFPDHSIHNLRVQCIDTTETIQELKDLEHFWIATLRTTVPLGLNVLP